MFKLKNETTRRKYEIEIGGRFAPNDEETDANTLWEGIKSAINDTSKDLLGYKKPKKPKPWISAEVTKLSEERSKVKLLKKTDSSKKGKYNFLTREIKRKTKGCKDKWMKELCANVDKAHQATKSKEVYATIKKITNKPTTRMQTVKSKEGEVLTGLQDVKNRWKENNEELYNNQNPVNKEMTDGIPQMPSYEEEPDILRGEVTAAIKKLTDNKAPGYDNTTAEELKATGEIGVDVPHRLCNIILKTEVFPDDWGKAISCHHHPYIQEKGQT